MRCRAVVDTAITIVATARLIRLLTEDQIGVWYFRDPIEAWGDRHEIRLLDQAADALRRHPGDEALARKVADYDQSRPWSWQARVASGASCRYCVGFWVGVLILVGDALTRTTAFGWARPAWAFAKAALALNVAATWVGKRTDTLP